MEPARPERRALADRPETGRGIDGLTMSSTRAVMDRTIGKKKESTGTTRGKSTAAGKPSYRQKGGLARLLRIAATSQIVSSTLNRLAKDGQVKRDKSGRGWTA